MANLGLTLESPCRHPVTMSTEPLAHGEQLPSSIHRRSLKELHLWTLMYLAQWHHTIYGFVVPGGHTKSHNKFIGIIHQWAHDLARPDEQETAAEVRAVLPQISEDWQMLLRTQPLLHEAIFAVRAQFEHWPIGSETEGSAYFHRKIRADLEALQREYSAYREFASVTQRFANDLIAASRKVPIDVLPEYAAELRHDENMTSDAFARLSAIIPELEAALTAAEFSPPASEPFQSLTSDATPIAITSFIERWEKSGGSEKANYALFFTELCDEILHVPHPEPAGPDNARNLYVFERAVTHKDADGSSSTGFIDLYKSGCLLAETKQGTFAKAKQVGTLLDFIPQQTSTKSGHGKRGTASFDKVLQRAYNQGRKYITALPAAEGRPPFLIICDVGHTIDVYAEFSGTGGHYERFPDPASYRIHLADLHRPEIRERLRKIWTDPHSLDPSKHAAKVTREVAKALAELAKSLEKDDHDPKVTAGFLQRCLFTMFAEDVELLPKNSFLSLLEKLKDSPAGFPVMLQTLWNDMAKGSDFSTVLFGAIPHFNGGLFEDTTALPLKPEQMALLIHAAKSDWAAVEPAIFGTLVERALDPRERHKLGAHYTPRSYVERLIRPALIDPLREEWEAVKAAASLASEKAAKAEITAAAISEDAKRHIQSRDKTKADASNKRHKETLKQAEAHRAEALAAVHDFHRQLAELRVLDPACGSGNFLYVSLELMKRLEAEVLDAYEELGGDIAFEMKSFKVGPRQFLGLEINRRAVAIAQLVLWIGFFQWQRKTTGKADTNERPLLPKEPSIVQQDAVLAYDAAIPRKDPDTGEILTIWDGITTKPHPVTGKEVPDETARKALFDYSNPRRADWPQADVIVGNPPFIGASRMRDALGDGYAETLRQAWKGRVPESADFVMYWWRKAAELVQDGSARCSGFITTNSIHQTFNRRVIEPFVADGKKPLHLAYAIPDHPWVDSADGAAVRIAMTVAAPGKGEGILEKVVAEQAREDGEHEVTLSTINAVITADLKTGANLGSTTKLEANRLLANRGVQLIGGGFILSGSAARERLSKNPKESGVLRSYFNGRDVMHETRDVYAIDFFGYSEEEARAQFPDLYQHVLLNVKPERLQNNRSCYRDKWWIFGEPVKVTRNSIEGLRRFIITCRTSRHRVFLFMDSSELPDAKLVTLAFEDPYFLGVLSSSLHVRWANLTGGWLGVGNDSTYNHSVCFNQFPFPALDEGPLKQRIRDLGERLDAHRKRQQELHPDLTLTGLYNVLEAVRAGTPLSAKEKAIHDKGLVSILRQLHDELDDAVLQAYGWGDLAVETQDGKTQDARQEQACAELLTRLVALNHERAAEEKRGLIRWLRPDYQNPSAAAPHAIQATLQGTESAETSISNLKSPIAIPWPTSLPAQVAAIQKLLTTHDPDPEILSAQFEKKSTKRTQQIVEILQTLQGLGKL